VFEDVEEELPGAWLAHDQSVPGSAVYTRARAVKEFLWVGVDNYWMGSEITML